MPLKEQDRQRLDAIVSQMEASGESPDNINAVVGDFKSKYSAEPAVKASLGGPGITDLMKIGSMMPAFLANQTVTKGSERAYAGAREGVLNTQGRELGPRVAQAAHEVMAGTGRAMAPVAAATLMTNPVGFALGSAGGYLGGQAAEYAANKAGLQPEYVSLAGDFGGIAGGGIATRPGVVDAVRSIPSALGNVAGKTFSNIVGRTTGVGPKPLERALNNPTPELVDQMRNPDVDGIVKLMREAAENAKDQRRSAYTSALAKLPKEAIDPSPVNAALSKSLADYRVGSSYQGGNRILHFDSSPIGESGQKDIQAVNDLVSGWKDWSTLGADALKRRLDDFYSDNGQARAMVMTLRDSLKREIVRQVPAYGEMTGDYSKATKFLDNVKDLSLDSKNQGTAVRKLTTLLNQNNDFREGVVNTLQQFSPADLQGQLSGASLSRLGPRGIGGALDAAALLQILAQHSLSPAAAVGVLATSPRLMGEAAYGLGKMGRAVSSISSKVPHAAIPLTAGASTGNSTRQLMELLQQLQGNPPVPLR